MRGLARRRPGDPVPLRPAGLDVALRPRRPRRAAGGEWPGGQAPGPRDGGGDHGRRDARRRRGPVGRAARVDGRGARGRGSRGGGGRSAGPRRRLDPVHRQPADRHPRGRARQRRHGLPPADRRLAQHPGRRHARPHPPGLSGGPALAGCRPQRGPRDRPGRGVRGPHAGDPGAHRSGGVRGAPLRAPGGPGRGRRLVAIPYLVAAYLAQEAFKEPSRRCSCSRSRCCSRP